MLRTAAWLTFIACQTGFAQTSPAPSGATAPTKQGSATTAPSPVSRVEGGVALPTTTVTTTVQRETPQHLKQHVLSGALGSRRQLDTPFSLTVVGQEQLAERQVNKIGDVFSGDASVTDGSDAYNAWANYIYVRGLQLDWQTGYRLDGLPFMSYGVTMPYEHLARVELLKGLSGFMYGFVAPGGVVNYVTKQPTDERLASVDVGYRSDSVWREHADLGGRVGPNNMFGYRLNVTHEEGGTFNGGNINRDAVSLALDARITRDLTWNFNTFYQDSHSSGMEPSFYVGSTYAGSGLPTPLSMAQLSGLSNTDQHLHTITQVYSTGLQYQLTPDWKLSANYSFNKSTRDRREDTLTLLNEAGDYSGARATGRELNEFQLWQVQAEGRVRTGPLAHHLVIGAAWQRQINDYSAYGADAYQAFSGNLATGNDFQSSNNPDLTTERSSDSVQKALFASDTIDLTPRWSVLAGLRYTNYSQNSAGLPNYTKNGITTPTFGLMYKVTPNTTVYASYVESLEPGTVVSTLYANRGALLNPLKSKQYEVGLKTEQSSWSATAALFRIERGAQYATAENVLVQDGRSIYQGVEMAGALRLGRQWQLGASAMLLDTKYDKGAANIGNRVAGAPRFVLGGNVGYKVPWVPGLSIGMDAKFNGRTALNAANTIDVPGYLLINAGATYRTRVAGHGVTLRAALSNLTNRHYWEYQYEGYIKPGDPRTISLNAQLDF